MMSKDISNHVTKTGVGNLMMMMIITIFIYLFI